MDLGAIRVDDGLLEPEHRHEELDEPQRVAGAERGPYLGCWCAISHGCDLSAAPGGPAWTFRNSSVTRIWVRGDDHRIIAD